MKRLFALCLSFALSLSLCCSSAFAANLTDPQQAADALHNLGLFNGTGTDANGNPIYELERTPTRNEAVTMLVTLLGKIDEAKQQEWKTPFSDVVEWAKPAVGYAYQNGLTSGTSATTYGGDQPVSAAQYITFVLSALGYETGVDFQWDKSFELSNQLGITNGEYDDASTFTRGDIAIISYNALEAKMKGQDITLLQTLPLSQQPTQPEEPVQQPTPQRIALTVDNIDQYLDFNAEATATVGETLSGQIADGNVTVSSYSRMTAIYEDVTVTFALETNSSGWGSMGMTNGWDTVQLSSDGYSKNVYRIYSFIEPYVAPRPNYYVRIREVTGYVTLQ